MKTHHYGLMVFCIAVVIAVASSPPAPPPETEEYPHTYGSVAVSHIVRIAPDGTLYCNIDAFPPVVGQNIPVLLEGIEPADTETVNKDVIAFLEQTLKPKSPDQPPTIVLNNIRRGQTFCLIADIEIDGKDLARLLIEKGLARRIIRLETAEESSAAAPAVPQPIRPAAAPTLSLVGSKSSKVFHRSTCPHAQRITPATMITFRTRQEAEQNGRRPCKTCNP